jgi:integrase
MPRHKLTAAFVAKPPPVEKDRTIFWDEAQPGFGLVVTEAGHKSYVVQYRANGFSRRMTIDGVLPLDQARKQAKKLLGKVADDKDPLGERREKVAAEKDTLQAVAEEYLKRESKNLRTADQRRAILERAVYPKLGTRYVGDIKRSEIVRLLDQIEDDRGPVMADMVLAILRRIFTWHASRSDEFRSPIVRGMARSKPKERARERILSDDELRAVWRTAEGFPKPWGQFVRLLLLTATRRNETACLGWLELKGDDWTIPGDRYKTKSDVTLPLSRAAKAVLAELPRIEKCPFAFTTDGKRPISGFTKFKKRFDEACGVTGWTPHDLRRTARTLLSRAGIVPNVAERCLGHVIPGVRGVYDRHQYRKEMLHAFEALATQIERIVKPRSNVTALSRRRG